MGWLLVLGIKEGMVECETVCVKSVVILEISHFTRFSVGGDILFVYFSQSVKKSMKLLFLAPAKDRQALEISFFRFVFF